MRFGKLDTWMLPEIAAASSDANTPDLSPFQDSMPIHLSVLVNGKTATLPPFLPTCRPNMDGRRNARPVSVTPLVRCIPLLLFCLVILSFDNQICVVRSYHVVAYYKLFLLVHCLHVL